MLLFRRPLCVSWIIQSSKAGFSSRWRQLEAERAFALNMVEIDERYRDSDVVVANFANYEQVADPEGGKSVQSFVYAPSFKDFLEVPKLIASSSVNQFMRAFCKQPVHTGVRFCRSKMGERFGYYFYGKATFLNWFPIFITTLELDRGKFKMARIQLMKMTSYGLLKHEYAYPAVYYYGLGGWSCLIKIPPLMNSYCMIGNHPMSARDGRCMFALPCGDFVTCYDHSHSYLSQKSFDPWLYEQSYPLRNFRRVDNFVCPRCSRLAVPYYCDLTQTSDAFKSKKNKHSTHFLNAIWSDWMYWLSRG